MNFCSDNRVQSLQVGAALSFGFLVLGFSLYRARGVPEGPEQAASKRSQQVDECGVSLAEDVGDTAPYERITVTGSG